MNVILLSTEKISSSSCRMIRILLLFWIDGLVTSTSSRQKVMHASTRVATIPNTSADSGEEAARSTAIFFSPVNPQLFTAWRRQILAPRGLFSRTDPLRFETSDIHRTVSSVVFPPGTLERIKDTFPSTNDTSRLSPTARAVIRAIYTIRIHRDLFGPLPKYSRHEIYRYIQNFDLSTHRRDVSRVLTFMLLIPRVPYVWDSWKYLADRYKLASVVELARIVGSIAADTRMFWFEEMFSY